MAESIAGDAVVYGLGLTGSGNPVTGFLGGLVVAESDWNVGGIDFTREFKLDEIATQSGGSIGTIIASQKRRKITVDFVPQGDTRVLAADHIDQWVELEELTVLTIARFKVAAINGTWNYMGGLSVKVARETYVLCNISLQQVQKEDGSWAALPLVVEA